MKNNKQQKPLYGAYVNHHPKRRVDMWTCWYDLYLSSVVRSKNKKDKENE